jgi:predicted nucleotidyltransferase
MPVFVRARDVLEELGIPYVVGGGLAVGYYNHQRLTKDIDFFITEESAEDAIEGLHRAGFLIKRSDPNWLYQSWWDDTLVDLVFAINVSRARIPVDEEMIARGIEAEIFGERFRIISPEDLVIIKILVMHESRPDWWDAITIIRKRFRELDWERIMHYAAVDMKKFLAFLLFTQSRHWSETLWPEWVLQRAWDTVAKELGLAPHTKIAA